jgi:hypothetical protein
LISIRLSRDILKASSIATVAGAEPANFSVGRDSPEAAAARTPSSAADRITVGFIVIDSLVFRFLGNAA